MSRSRSLLPIAERRFNGRWLPYAYFLRAQIVTVVVLVAFPLVALFSGAAPLLNGMERTAGPVLKLVENLSASDPEKLAAFRRQYDTLIAEYMDADVVRQDYLMTRATKV